MQDVVWNTTGQTNGVTVKISVYKNGQLINPWREPGWEAETSWNFNSLYEALATLCVDGSGNAFLAYMFSVVEGPSGLKVRTVEPGTDIYAIKINNVTYTLDNCDGQSSTSTSTSTSTEPVIPTKKCREQSGSLNVITASDVSAGGNTNLRVIIKGNGSTKTVTAYNSTINQVNNTVLNTINNGIISAINGATNIVPGIKATRQMMASTINITVSSDTDIEPVQISILKGGTTTIRSITLNCESVPVYNSASLKSVRSMSAYTSVDEAYDDAVTILKAATLAANAVGNGDCDKWYVEDYGDWKYYWCYVFEQYKGSGMLPYEVWGYVLECHENEEYIWEKRAEVKLPECDSVGKYNMPFWNITGYNRDGANPETPKGGQPWWPTGKDGFMLSVDVTGDRPLNTVMCWCPYLLAPGEYDVHVNIYSPMLRGAVAENQGAVRGWVPDYGCETQYPVPTPLSCAADLTKYLIACDNDGTEQCPRLTGCNPAGQAVFQLWTAGWTDEKNSPVKMHDTGALKGRSGFIPEAKVGWEYLIDPALYIYDPVSGQPEHIKLVGKIKVNENQQRGYVGLTMNISAFGAAHGAEPGSLEYSNIWKYIFCPSTEYFAVEVNFEATNA